MDDEIVFHGLIRDDGAAPLITRVEHSKQHISFTLIGDEDVLIWAREQVRSHHATVEVDGCRWYMECTLAYDFPEWKMLSCRLESAS